jgi:hypothetical protein
MISQDTLHLKNTSDGGHESQSVGHYTNTVSLSSDSSFFHKTALFDPDAMIGPRTPKDLFVNVHEKGLVDSLHAK